MRWTEAQLAAKTMRNVRHLWSSVRPNGDRRPYNLNRLELRICDLIVDPLALLAVTALLEARLLQMFDDPTLDPLKTNHSQDLIALTDANEAAAAKFSLDAELRHWRDGSKIIARDWIQEIYERVYPVAKANGIGCFLSPLKKILRFGNTAQQWLQLHQQGIDVPTIIQQEIQNIAQQEKDLEDAVCREILVA